ncbi:DUF1800 domain-containing protein [Mycobacterium sp. 852002-51057_SCH5723018]|uniref:DUF1800 domain-containing protein n=1 Tax=Mycobacterium sp. 852002-51057_SCH5723018 TaxID=1834094 RepID=UPI000801BC7F|nr:DUF1800 domain-containing protein [Mycobacterium sp. 852002-51057_SCH5723018]OBG21031.1 hypothetical protein A5764_14610 [Mycobacterium sp. 852002-51057_SCH5723018]
MPGQSTQWITTARMLRRAGFGVTGPEVDAAVRLDWPSCVDAMLGTNPDTDPGAVVTPMPTLEPPRAPGKRATPAARKQYNQQLNEQQSVLSDWWLSRMVSVRQPIHEKLTLLWHNHFATSARKVRVAAHMAAQNQKLRTLSLGDFRALAYAMLTDAATLRWLDGQSSTAKAPNENLAREFMELFALGHGNGYTEDDVRAGARALTGWVIGANGETSVVPKRHDGGDKTLFGLTRNFDAAAFCDAVLAQPKSAQYVAGRLWQQLASDEPPSPQALDRLVAAYGPRRDLRALTRAILTDAEFTGARAAVVNTPVEWLVGTLRALRVPSDNPAQRKITDATLQALGQRPFYPPNVGGWPHGPVWLSTASAQARLRAASRLAQLGDLSAVESAAPDDRIDAVGYLIGVGAWSDRTADALAPLVRNPPQLVATAVNTPEYLTS